jgi:hypothetical protein
LVDTEAKFVLLLIQYPVVDAVKLVVLPTQIGDAPDTDIVGLGKTDTSGEFPDEHPVEASVNTNVVEPVLMPVTIPALSMVAMDGLLLTHDPPLLGNNVVVLPGHIAASPKIAVVGLEITKTLIVPLPLQLDELTKLKDTPPLDTPVTRPVALTVAIAGFELVHVPPLLGDNWVFPPIQIVDGP